MKNKQAIPIFSLAFLVVLGAGPFSVFAVEEPKKETAQKPAGVPPAVAPPPVGVPGAAARPVPSVVEIQRQLQDIIRIHQTLQAQHHAQIREIQRITEQARLHQQLLKNLAPAKSVPTAAPAGVNIDELIRLQKIQLIQEQARQNKNRLEEIKQTAPPSGETPTAPPAETAPPENKPQKTA